MASLAPVATSLFDRLDMAWPPMAHVRRGWERLDEENRALVARRMEETLAAFTPPAHVNAAALRRFFSFLSQVEVIAIEVPMSALPTARDEVRPLLERQLADEVFHAAIFHALALKTGGLDQPIPEAERLLDHIRRQDDPKTTAVLLNLLAEGWIENLFDHAVTWGVCDDVFRIVLEDEARHVEEAHAHAEGLDLASVRDAVRAFEDELFRLVQHPRVMLPTLALAGEEKFRELSESFLRVHRDALAEVGLEPHAAVAEMERTLNELKQTEAARDLESAAPPRPRRIEPESQWRRTALQLWDAPRHPVMNGWFDARVDHVPRKLLTPVVIAAVGRVWKEYPRLNRFTIGGELYEPQTVNVGVRVALGDKGEALSSIVIPEADKRSIRDIARILEASVKRMNELGAEVETAQVDPTVEPLRSVLKDEELMTLVPPDAVAAPVTVSNVGRSGLHAGFGAMPGALGQSVEVIIGRVEKRPVWKLWRYKPVDVVTIGAGADHRVVDGNHCAEAMARLEAALSPESVKEILARPDTIPGNADLADQALEEIGFTQDRAKLIMSCKAPFWLGWLCWLFKK